MVVRERPKLQDIQAALAQVLRKNKPKSWAGAATLPHVIAGRTCNHCKQWMDPAKGAAELQACSFWEKCYHNRDDGHDLKPQHIGHPGEFSVCKLRNCAAHQLSTCEKWDEA